MCWQQKNGNSSKEKDEQRKNFEETQNGQRQSVMMIVYQARILRPKPTSIAPNTPKTAVNGGDQNQNDR